MTILRPLLLLVALACATTARADVPTPEIQGPIASPEGAFIQATSFDLSQVGYVKEEYFLKGTASAYANVGPLGDDGMWTVQPAATAPYKTRIVVFKPAKPKKFNGTVIVEWLNVSGGVDAAPDWTLGHVELIRDGFAYVGVSAQFVGVEGGPGLVNVISLPLKKVNPARYGTLSHPGDSFSYDMFSQAGAAVRSASGPLQDLKIKKVIAIGESQSAFRMVTYIDAVHPLARMFDGFLVHSRGAFGVGLSEAPQPAIAVPGAAQIRADLDVPVLTFETETDLTFLGYFGIRQDDSKNFRLWEVAGTSHADSYTLVTGNGDLGTDPAVVGITAPSSPLPGIIDCNFPINSGPQHFVLNAAFSALNKWVRKGKAPKSAPRLDVSAGPPVAIVDDANGNATGGIRTPQVDVPVAAFSGEQAGSILCILFGTTDVFDAAQLSTLYPTHKDFVSAWNKSLKKSVKAGWILKPDAKIIKQWAATAPIGG
jgi:hypothetical protein